MPRCTDCGQTKSAPCPVCGDIGDPAVPSDCGWCGGIRVACQDGPHFTGIRNSAPLAELEGTG